MRPFTFSLVTLAVLAAQGASVSAQGAGAVTILSEKFSGGGCSDDDSTAKMSPSGDFEVRFTNLFASATSPGPNATSVCDVSVVVQPPTGFALAISGASLEGAARVQNGVASVKNYYSIGTSSLEDEWNSSSSNWLPDEDDADKDRSTLQAFTQKFGPGFDSGNVPPEWQGKCGAPTLVTGKLTLEASVEDGGSAEIYADRTLVPRPDRSRTAGTSSLMWDWVLVPCTGGGNPQPTEPVLDGAWRFSYLAPSGRTLSGRMVVSGTTGTYRAEGQSWTGKLKDLRAEAGSVKGKWEALDLKGWVEFKPSSDGRSFEGQYGKEGQAALGFWNLKKE